MQFLPVLVDHLKFSQQASSVSLSLSPLSLSYPPSHLTSPLHHLPPLEHQYSGEVDLQQEGWKMTDRLGGVRLAASRYGG